MSTKAKNSRITKLGNRDKVASADRDRPKLLSWTQQAFKAMGEDDSAPASAEADTEMVDLSPDARPDLVNGSDTALGMGDDIPLEVIIGLSVAFFLLLIIMLVSCCLVVYRVAQKRCHRSSYLIANIPKTP